MSTALKNQLLSSAHDRSYFSAQPEVLEELWTVSSGFIESGRLISLEMEWYPLLEQHFFLSLLTCRDAVAKLMLKLIMEKFGVESRRIYKLRTAFVTCTVDAVDLERHIKNLNAIEYDSHKIAMTNLKAAGDYKGFIQALSNYLDQNPVDAEAWSELAEAYAHVGDFESAVGSLDQCLVLEPLAYNVFARIGELKRLQAASSISGGFSEAKALIASSIDHLCRSVELNPLYLRGWCGLYTITNISVEPDVTELNAKAKAAIEKLVQNNIGPADDLEAAKQILGFS